MVALPYLCIIKLIFFLNMKKLVFLTNTCWTSSLASNHEINMEVLSYQKSENIKQFEAQIKAKQYVGQLALST